MSGKIPLSKLSPEELRKALFYAEAEAGLYDQNIKKVVPEYQLAHTMLLDLLSDRFQEVGGSDEEATGSILDVGAGTGQEALAILSRFPRVQVVAVDLSRPILDVFERKLKRRPNMRARCEIVCGDIIGEYCTPERLQETLPESERGLGFQGVVSAFTLHHLDSEEKAEVFRRIHSLLADGGLFLNLDLYTFQSSRLAKQALDFDLAWIDRHFGLLEEGETSPALKHLGELWKEHYLKYNRTEPVERGDDRSPTPGQEEMLRRIGFHETAMPFRYWQSGILWARK
jgi:SAM-dependent methyltransferase